jgi:DNA-directed RNA polymerase subunit RPC12/RpoP
MNDRISLLCTGCAAKLRAPRALLGRTCSCPRCGRRVLVQVKAPSDADVAIVPDDAPTPTPWKSQAPWR